MNQPDTLNKENLTNTGDVHNNQAAVEGQPIPEEQQEGDNPIEGENIPYFEEKKAVLNYFGAELMVLEGPAELDELDQIVVMKSEDDQPIYCVKQEEIDLHTASGSEEPFVPAPKTLRQLYQVVLDAKPVDPENDLPDAAEEVPSDTPDEPVSEDDGLAPLSEAQQAWISRNPLFDTDQDFQAEAIGAHEVAVQKGLAVDSEEYFAFIDARLKLVFPQSPAEQSEPKEESLSASQKSVVVESERG